MLHTLQPQQFVVAQQLGTACKCPDCETRFVYRDGVMALAHYRDLAGGIRQALMCFCSTRCLLQWEPPALLGRMH